MNKELIIGLLAWFGSMIIVTYILLKITGYQIHLKIKQIGIKNVILTWWGLNKEEGKE